MLYYVEMNDAGGEYKASDRAGALDAFAKDAGYGSWDSALSQGLVNDEVLVIAIDSDSLFEAVSNATGQAVFHDSYGSGIALVDGVSYTTHDELAALAGKRVWDFKA